MLDRLIICDGLRHFPSIFDPYVKTAGMVSLPIGDETSIGGPAMLIVGCDDIERASLVRNNWNAEWGPENP